MTVPIPVLLLAGSHARNLEVLGQLLERQGCMCRTALGLEAFDEAIDSGDAFDLALVDVTGLDAGVWQRCKRLHDRDVHLLVISPRQSASLHQQGLSHGAQGVLVKPLIVRELVDLVRSLVSI